MLYSFLYELLIRNGGIWALSHASPVANKNVGSIEQVNIPKLWDFQASHVQINPIHVAVDVCSRPNLISSDWSHHCHGRINQSSRKNINHLISVYSS